MREIPGRLRWTGFALAAFLVVCWLFVFVERTCTDDKGCAGFGYLALFGLLASQPIWVVGVIATIVWTLKASWNGIALRRRYLIVFGELVAAITLHPALWVWLFG